MSLKYEKFGSSIEIPFLQQKKQEKQTIITNKQFSTNQARITIATLRKLLQEGGIDVGGEATNERTRQNKLQQNQQIK